MRKHYQHWLTQRTGMHDGTLQRENVLECLRKTRKYRRSRRRRWKRTIEKKYIVYGMKWVETNYHELLMFLVEEMHIATGGGTPLTGSTSRRSHRGCTMLPAFSCELGFHIAGTCRFVSFSVCERLWKKIWYVSLATHVTTKQKARHTCWTSLWTF